MSNNSNTRVRRRVVNGNASVVTEVKKAGVLVSNKEHDLELDANESLVNPARVSVKLGITKNLGNFNSLRVDVQVEYPCEPKEEAVASTVKRVSGWVQMFIEQEIEEAESNVG